MSFDFADAKRQARQVVHDYLAVSAVYTSPDGEIFGTVNADLTVTGGVTIRWHNKLVRNGAMDGDFSGEIFEGVNRLVFQQPQLDASGVVLERLGTIMVPKYDNHTFTLDLEGPSDGPLNVYWNVV